MGLKVKNCEELIKISKRKKFMENQNRLNNAITFIKKNLNKKVRKNTTM